MLEQRITVKEDGTLEVDSSGFQGGTCIKELDEVMADLEKEGIKFTGKDQKKKPEYHASRSGIHTSGR